MVFLGRDIAEQRDYSERMAEEIDEEVRRIIDEAHERCRRVLAKHVDSLHVLAARLIEVETVEGDDLKRLLGAAENRIPPEDQPAVAASTSAPPRDGARAGEEPEEDQPQGRPGLAWGQSNVAPPPPGD
jgi:cell division protease FtsH